MRRPHGYLTVFDPAPLPGQAKQFESDFACCGHCGRHFPVPPNTDVASVNGGRCRACNEPLCIECAKKNECRPLEAWLERVEQAWEKMGRW